MNNISDQPVGTKHLGEKLTSRLIRKSTVVETKDVMYEKMRRTGENTTRRILPKKMTGRSRILKGKARIRPSQDRYHDQ